jgi:replicative DNA helicase
MTFGFHPGDMIVLAARPSMGKTSLALNFAEAAALPSGAGLKPAHTLVFSLEMTAQSLAMRLICARAGVDMQQLREGTVRKAETLDAITKTASEFLKAPIKINDSSGLSITEIRAIARRIHQREPLQLIVIDYLQLVKGSSRTDNREQEVSEISRGVKALAKELQVPVIVLSQLNRATEKDNRQPRLSDLRESGAIEQDADVVLLISHVEGAKDEDKMQPQITVDLIIAKQRNGQVGKIPLQFKKSITRFFETSYAG